MAEIKPFKGILYNPHTIGDYSAVVAPPYDVISEDMREDLYQKSPFNIIRLILGKTQEGDNGNNQYTRAKALLEEWQKKGVLSRDGEENFYLYAQEYEHRGKVRRRAGFLGRIKIDEKEGDEVLPHEYTHSKPKEDRLNLIKEVKTNLSPIFTLFYDDSGKVNAMLEEGMDMSSPVIDITIDGVRHILWKLQSSDLIKGIESEMTGKRLFIADGHHRYSVARTYRDFRRKEEGYNGEADHVMMYFADMADPENLTVMATHRVIKKMPYGDLSDVKAKLDKYFAISEQKDLASLTAELEKEETVGKVYGLLMGEEYLCLKPRDRKEIMSLIEENRTADWKDLDVSVLHSAVLGKLLAVSHEEGNITYVKDASEAETLVKDGSHMAAFLLNPTRVEQMKAVAEHGEMMPQKSTYFYPKLLTGLVVNKLGD